MPVTGAIFDCDGTLLDSTEVWLETQNALTEKAQAELSEDDLNAIWTYTIPEMGVFYHERFGLGASCEDVVAMIHNQMLESYRHKVKPRKGAIEFVRKLHEAGVVCSVASSTPTPLLQVAIEVSGFAPYMKAIISVDEVGVSKREPAVYDYARECMGTAKESTWIFEDSAYAVKTSKDAGYQVVAIFDSVTAGSWDALSPADIRIKEFEDLDPQTFISAH